MTASNFKSNTQYRKKRSTPVKDEPIEHGFRASVDRLKSPIIAFAILFIFLGLWMMIKPHIDGTPIQIKPEKEVSEVKKNQASLYRALHGR